MDMSTSILTPRWYSLRHHAQQQALWDSTSRFCVVPAGRRSGKTELGKRKVVMRAMKFYAAPSGRFIAAAPTRAQAKKIFWSDLKALVPKWALAAGHRHPISESELSIQLYNGARIEVWGMEAPERIEGDPIDGILLDEYGNMRPHAWTAHVRPGLFTEGRPPGWAWFTGVPEGRNHYYKLYKEAQRGKDGWSAFTWTSNTILPQEEIDAARDEMDELTFQQEYNASFITFQGRAYYPYEEETHAEKGCAAWYDTREPLHLCFDFNVKPGVAVVVQDLDYRGVNGDCAARVSAVIGECWIANNSNTDRIARMILQKWGDHKGDVVLFGDPAGGARGTAKVRGSDWDILREVLSPRFGKRLRLDVANADPGERPRINALNARLRSAKGTVRMVVDPLAAPHTAEDLDGVRTDDRGHIDKRTDPMLSHLSDALAYRAHRLWGGDTGGGAITIE